MVNGSAESTPRSRRQASRKLAGALVALSTAVAAHGQTVLYVDDDAPPGGNGRSWGEAFSDLQDALWLASFIWEDTEIRIAEGIYTPDRGTGIQDASFDIDHSGSVSSSSTLGFGIILKGAFAGIKALDPNERDTNRFKSILSGDLNGDDLPGFVNYGDNSHRILESFEIKYSEIELDGLVFRGGNGEGRNGGALSLAGSPVTVRDCTFVENRASSGGAVYAQGYANMTFDRCFFGLNLATEQGGAIRMNSRGGSVSNCVFSGNSAGRNGGAIANLWRITISECTFFGNSAGGTGGAFSSWNGSILSNSVFTGNMPDQIAPRGGSTIPVSYSDVQNGYPGVGNIDMDPLFTDPLGQDGILGTPDDNFLPRFGSPIIDAGSNDAVLNPQGLDFVGQPRIVDDRFTPDTGLGTAPIVDMGAYEFQSPDCYADLDHTTGVGVLDLFDFLRFQQLFVTNDPLACQVDRSTGSNICDIFDFLAFQSEFAAGCP